MDVFRRKMSVALSLMQRASLFQRVIGKLPTRIQDPDAWVFVVGCYNSGTTLLAELIRLSAKVQSLPWEGAALSHHLKRCVDFGFPRMSWKVESRISQAESRLGVNEIKEIKRQWKFSARPHGGQRPIFLEKSITNTLRVPFLARHFSPALFIHIVRDPVAVCEGIRRKARPADENLPPYSINDCIRMWHRSNSMLLHDLDNRHHLLIRYEDLCADPLSELAAIDRALFETDPSLPALGVTLPPDGLKVHGRRMQISNQNSTSYENLAPEEIDEIHSGAGELLARFGYGGDSTA